jgi:hypothetical protein
LKFFYEIILGDFFPKKLPKLVEFTLEKINSSLFVRKMMEIVREKIQLAQWQLFIPKNI